MVLVRNDCSGCDFPVRGVVLSVCSGLSTLCVVYPCTYLGDGIYIGVGLGIGFATLSLYLYDLSRTDDGCDDWRSGTFLVFVGH